MSPVLSLVMPVLNRAPLIARAIASVDTRGQAEIEIIVVDGGSTDGTPEIARRSPFVRVLSLPGSSIYEALNAGLRIARAPLLGQLNSDDRLTPGSVDRVLTAARDNPGALILRGRAVFVAGDGDAELRRLDAPEKRAELPLTLKGVTFGAPVINACFVRPEAYQRIGYYDESLRIAADREWLMRAVLARLPVALVDYPVYEYLVHSGSATIARRAATEGDYAWEHLEIASRALASPSLAPEDRQMLRSWHAQETVRVLWRGRGRHGLRAVLGSSFRTSPAWPLHALGPMAHYAFRRVAGGSAG